MYHANVMGLLYFAKWYFAKRNEMKSVLCEMVKSVLCEMEICTLQNEICTSVLCEMQDVTNR